MDLRYRDILVYNTFRTDFGKLVIYNIFDNVRTYSNSVKAIEQFKKDKDRDKLSCLGRYWFKSNPSQRLNVQRLGSLIGRVATGGNRNICWHGMCN